MSIGRFPDGSPPDAGRVPPDLWFSWSPSAETSYDVRAIAVRASYDVRPMPRIPLSRSSMVPWYDGSGNMADVGTSRGLRLICDRDISDMLLTHIIIMVQVCSLMLNICDEGSRAVRKRLSGIFCPECVQDVVSSLDYLLDVICNTCAACAKLVQSSLSIDRIYIVTHLFSIYHHHIGSINLSHLLSYFPCLCVWGDCTFIF